MTDRVRLSQGLPQIYGTQWSHDNKPHPIEDEAGVNARRAEVGLEPLENYAAQMRRLPNWGQALDLTAYLKCLEQIGRELPPKYRQQL